MSFRLPFNRSKPESPKNQLATEDAVSIEPHVRSLIDESGAVLLDLKAGRYYSLNGVGARIWCKAEAGMTPSQILADLQQLYQVPIEKLAADLTAFLSTMEGKGLLRARA